MIKRPFVTLFLLLFLLSVNAQQEEKFRIIFPKTNAERVKACNTCKTAFKQKPRDIGFSIINEKGNLYFKVNNKAWFKSLFKASTDGLALDIVAKERYNCDSINITKTQLRGILLKPTYRDRLFSTLMNYQKDKFRVFLGKVPAELEDKELEYNILFLNNKTLCRYQTIYNLKAYRWDLLDMGLYLDTIVKKEQKITSTEEEIEVTKYKTLKFVIPFEKNKMAYSSEDIKPLYDSLNLTNFNIKTINIKAYASVEGSLERNMELQQGRAQTIAEALQSYQEPSITTNISSSENWVEFFYDITNTKYENLKTQSKTAIKQKLIGAFSSEMEPILKKHRKALVTLSLEKKDSYKTMAGSKLVDAFNTAINDNNLSEAEKIQKSLFQKLQNKVISPKLIGQLKIPNQAKYSNLLNSNSVIKYQQQERMMLNVRKELQQLEKLDPNNPRIKYNLAVIKFRVWKFNIEEINPEQFKYEILGLKNFGIAENLIERMMVNYYIILAEKSRKKRDFTSQDKAVLKLKMYFDKIPKTDLDYFSIAQFLSYYGNDNDAAVVLSDRATKIDVDEDLLFYYLNLTLTRAELTKTDQYRGALFNAYNLNNTRYCELFSAPEKNGVTFQLLEDAYLKNAYCELCVND